MGSIHRRFFSRTPGLVWLALVFLAGLGTGKLFDGHTIYAQDDGAGSLVFGGTKITTGMPKHTVLYLLRQKFKVAETDRGSDMFWISSVSTGEQVGSVTFKSGRLWAASADTGVFRGESTDLVWASLLAAFTDIANDPKHPICAQILISGVSGIITTGDINIITGSETVRIRHLKGKAQEYRSSLEISREIEALH